MEIKVTYFGLIAELAGKSEEALSTPSATSARALREHLENLYPELRQRTYQVAINHSIAHQDTVIQSGDEIAILPPFAGG